MEQEQQPTFDSETLTIIKRFRKREVRKIIRKVLIIGTSIIIPQIIIAFIAVVVFDLFPEGITRRGVEQIAENIVAFSTIAAIFIAILLIIIQHYRGVAPRRKDWHPDTYAKGIVYKHKKTKSQQGDITQWIIIVAPNVDNFLRTYVNRPYTPGEIIQIEYDSKDPRACQIVEPQT